MRLASSVASVITAASLLVAATGTAQAQPGATTPVKRKSAGKAIAASAVPTLLSAGLLATYSGGSVFGGLFGVFAPSFGHWYAGHKNIGGMVIRAGAMFVTAQAAIVINDHQTDCLGNPDVPACEQDLRDRRRDAKITFGVGLGVFAASALFDIAMAGRYAEKWNAEHGFTVAPTVMPAAGGPAAGFAIVGRF
jgi:hypothetical protein